MKKNNQLLVAALGLFMASCGAGGPKKTPGGVEYTVHKSGSGAQLKLGDTVLMNITQRLNDSILAESRKLVGAPVPVLISKSVNKYDLMEGLALLKEGDSATFIIPWDSLPEPRPPFGKKGDKLKVTFAVENKYSASTQTAKEEKEIKEYLDAHKLNATKNAEGVYVSVSQPGTGDMPKPGDTVFVHYTGKLLSGKTFDSSLDSTLRPGMPLEPIKFPIGQGFVIKGWDAGIGSLNKGSKATLVIPSSLAYGLQGSPPAIPSNSVLVFDVQLVDVKPGKAPAAAPAAPGK
ncbi:MULTISPECIES: FKBP-type peptidyl-prolyl cis-trans isomerase [unclassified Chitinophaga]|uniref:FKBP-type peptidyl-prolyl cis-trans isomerase n=1 Tax=unclassified Chitinophaga TaxID=2619133 RepID=UPI001C3017D9|nr:FKBP-type peptidyl-prolyl cis-trans isomerase [Chitinophaga sp. GbtcB8]